MESKTGPSGSDSSTTSLGQRVGEITVGAHERIDQISDAAGPAVDRIASNAHAVIDTVAGAAEGAVDTLGVKSDQLKATQEKLVEAAREYIREQPLASLGIAVAAGWLVSRLLR